MRFDHDNLEEFQDPINYDLEAFGISSQDARIRFYAELVQKPGDSVLELACGTGIIAIPLAQHGARVTGIDLSKPMLEHAQAKAESLRLEIDWIHADAKTLELGRRFKLVYITGNAFQAFLTQADQKALLTVVKRHLTDDGVFAFETRNLTGCDLSDQLKEELWHEFTNSCGALVTVTGTQQFDLAQQVMHWMTFRRWNGESGARMQRTRIACKFIDVNELDALLEWAGFWVVERFGDWARAPFTATSAQIITVCRRKPSGEVLFKHEV